MSKVLIKEWALWCGAPEAGGKQSIHHVLKPRGGGGMREGKDLGGGKNHKGDTPANHLLDPAPAPVALVAPPS